MEGKGLGSRAGSYSRLALTVIAGFLACACSAPTMPTPSTARTASLGLPPSFAGTATVAASTPDCTAGHFRLRALDPPGGAGGTEYLMLALDHPGPLGCGVRRLQAFYLDGTDRQVGYPSRRSRQIYDETVARSVRSFVVPAGGLVSLRLATPEPASFGLSGCRTSPTTRVVVMVNQARVWLPSSLSVCTTSSGRPSIDRGPRKVTVHPSVTTTARQLRSSQSN